MLCPRTPLAHPRRPNSIPGLLSAVTTIAVLAAAVYPAVLAQCVRTFTQTRLIASDGSTNANLGTSAAISGTTIISGAPHALTNGGFRDGEAYIYTLSGGFWTQQTRLSGPARSESNFGAAVAIRGNTAIIGDPYEPAAYFSNRSGNSWSTPVALTRTETSGQDAFGSAVAMSSLGTHNLAIIGAPHYTAGGLPAEGAAFVMSISTQVAGGWVEVGFLIASDFQAYAQFGASVAISGNTAVVGAPFDTNTNGANAGAVYVFTSNSFGTGWTQQAKIIFGHADWNFGAAVAIEGDTIVVGAPGANSGRGQAGVYTRSGTVWSSHGVLAAVDLIFASGYGNSVAISGDQLVVGCPGGTSHGRTGAGYVQLNSRPPHSSELFGYQGEFVPGNAVQDDNFGASVAIDGTRVAAGAYGASPTQTDSGAAYEIDVGTYCPADFNCSGALEVADIFAFLDAWFGGSVSADFNASGALEVADIFAFLNAWFSGC